MLLIITIAATAAAAVIAFSQWREREPELAIETTLRAKQLAAVVVILCGAVEAILDSLIGKGRQTSYGSRRPSYEGNWGEDEPW